MEPPRESKASSELEWPLLLERLRDELQAERARLEQSQRELEAERAETRKLREDLDRERGRRQAEERERLSQETRSLLEEVQRARTQLRQAEAQLKSTGLELGDLAPAEQAINRAAEYIALGGKLRRAAQALEPRTEPEPAARWEELQIGALVRLVEIGAEGHIVDKPKRGKLTVAVGSLKTTVDVAQVTALRGRPKLQKPERPKQAPRPRAEVNTSGISVARAAANTVDLRGQRVDDALERVDAFIDQLLRSGEAAGFVLHGHGTGVLKSAVREHVRLSPHVARSEAAAAEDGGDALTVFWLR